MGIDTDELRLFILAAELLNISAAGRKLGMAPAVASAKLSKLEHRVGSELLHRTTRKVSLSVEGSDLLPFAREIIAQEEAALAALGHGSANATGTLRFTAPSTFAQMYIAPILHEFLAQYPEVSLDLRLSDLPFNLTEGSFDLALRFAPLSETSLKKESWRTANAFFVRLHLISTHMGHPKPLLIWRITNSLRSGIWIPGPSNPLRAILRCSNTETKRTN